MRQNHRAPIEQRTPAWRPLGVVFAGCLLTAWAAWAAAQTPSLDAALEFDRKLLAEIKTQSEIMANLAYLSDVIGPRLTGSANLKRANDWAAEKMKSYGLENVRLEGYTIPVGWERGTATARLIEPGPGRPLVIASAGWVPGTNGKIVGDVVVLQARNKQDLEKYKGKLKNAIVLRAPPANVAAAPTPGQRRGPPPSPPAADAAGGSAAARGGEQPPPERGGRPLGGGFGEAMAFRRELAEFLKAEGAAVIVNDAAKPHGLLVTTGSWRSGGDRVNPGDPLPAVYMAHENYAMLYRLATRPEPAKTQVEIEITNKFIEGPIPVYNTVGEIRGSEKPDEFVVLGAHLDSWDLASGTTDNGTGSSLVLEVARALAKSGVKPKRTIRFVLFSGEEQGLHGSRQYVAMHKDEMPKTSMALVHDTGTGRVLGIGLQGREAIKPILERELVALQDKEVGPIEITLRGMGGTDHVSFESAGVPGFACLQDMTEYRYTHHTQTDTLDKANKDNLVQGAQVMAVTAWRVANLPDLLPRDKPAATRERRSTETEPPAKSDTDKKDNGKKDGEKKDG